MNLTAEAVDGFTRGLLLSRFDNPRPTPQFHRELWDLCCSDHKYVAVAAPRGHAKSTAVTHSYGLACSLFRERDFTLIISDTESQAIQFLGDIKRELTENMALRELFGVKKLVKDAETDAICEMLDGHQFRFLAKGSEQKIRGIKWRNKRPNLILCDDLENDEIVLNDERRFKFRQWFLNALLPSGSDTCIVRYVGTILHLDSLLNRFMPSIEAATTIETPLKIYSTDESRAWESVLYRAHPGMDDFSQILWEEKFPEERLRMERQKYLDDGYPEGYAQEYLNNPIDVENAYFRKEDFQPLDGYKGPQEYYIAGDLAISERDQRAYTVFVIAAVSPDNILRVVGVERFRGDSREIIDMMFKLHQRYNPELFILEDENIAKSLGPILREEMTARGQFINLYPVSPIRDKIQRARSIQARFRAGSVLVDTDASWYPAFLQEFLYFPRGGYKDQVDALAWIGHVLDKMAPVPTLREIEDAEYEDEMQESMYFGFDGRDTITGY